MSSQDRVPDYSPTTIVIRWSPDGEPEVENDGGLAPWLLSRTLERAAYLHEPDLYFEMEVESADEEE